MLGNEYLQGGYKMLRAKLTYAFFSSELATASFPSFFNSIANDGAAVCDSSLPTTSFEPGSAGKNSGPNSGSGTGFRD